MNENPTFLQELLDTIKRSIPPKANLVNELAEILSIEKASVYRRIRGEVSFSFAEVALIARTLNIPLILLFMLSPRKNGLL